MLSQLQTFKNYIDKYELFNKDATILLAVSGGKDSVVMAHLFKLAGFNFAIAHCNFHLRAAESDRDEQFVKNLALLLNVPVHIIHFDTEAHANEHKISIQMAARDLRYDFFDNLCQEFRYEKVAIAQHQNDAMETVILNLIRGTGIAGLHGIKNSRENIIRPLMCFTRENIEDIITSQSYNFVEDSSNASAKYARNKIRLNIIPEMREINPSLEETFQKNIEYFSALEQFINQEIEDYRHYLIESSVRGFKIEIAKIRKLRSKSFVLSELLFSYGFNKTTVSDLINGLEGISGKVFRSEKFEIQIDRYYIFLYPITEQDQNRQIEFGQSEDLILFDRHTLKIIQQNIEETDFSNQNKCYVPTHKLIFPLKIRYWKEGDKFTPFGMKGMKKISDFFIQEKVPLSLKGNIPILINGDDKIIWIAGYRSDNRFKIENDTKKITTFEIKSERA